MRKYIDMVTRLDEKVFYEGPVKTRFYDLDNIKILENPSKREVETLKHQTKQQELRAMLDGGVLFVWDGSEMTHGDFCSAFHANGSDLFLKNDHVFWNDLDPDMKESHLRIAAEEVKSHKSIISIYGSDVRVVMEFSDSYETVTF